MKQFMLFLLKFLFNESLFELDQISSIVFLLFFLNRHLLRTEHLFVKFLIDRYFVLRGCPSLVLYLPKVPQWRLVGRSLVRRWHFIYLGLISALSCQKR